MISPNTSGVILADEAVKEATGSHAAVTARWQLVGTFGTLELAEAAVQRLAESRVESAICLIDGLSVIARR